MKNYLTHLVCIIVLALISVTYFYPVLSGKSIQQSTSLNLRECPNK